MLGDARVVAFAPSLDLGRARSFYEGILGLRVVDENPFALVIDAPGTTIRITAVGDLDARPFTVLGWEVPDVRATVGALSGRGVQFERFEGMDQDDSGIWTTPGGDQVAWFKDPDGNVLSLTELAGS